MEQWDLPTELIENNLLLSIKFKRHMPSDPAIQHLCMCSGQTLAHVNQDICIRRFKQYFLNV